MGTLTNNTESKRPARERLLEAADELFYAEGVQSVGIDRVIERAGVAKASLYSTFGSKEQLVIAYLQGRHDQTLEQLRAGTERCEDPVERILAVFDTQAEIFSEPGFRGCAFAGAAAEAPPGGLVEAATVAYRRDIRELFKALVTPVGVRDPELLASQLQLLFDGGGQAANLDHDPSIASASRAAAAALIDAASER